VIRSRTSKEERKYNSQKKKDKGTNNDLQNIAQKTNDQATRTPLKPEGELRCYGMVSSSAPHVVPVVLSKLRLDNMIIVSALQCLMFIYGITSI